MIVVMVQQEVYLDQVTVEETIAELVVLLVQTLMMEEYLEEQEVRHLGVVLMVQMEHKVLVVAEVQHR